MTISTMKDVLMNRSLERRAVFGWVARTVRPPNGHVVIILGANSGAVDPHVVAWETFAGVYPDDPAYRLYARTSFDARLEEFIRLEASSLHLPDSVRGVYDKQAAQREWDVAADVSRRLSIPVGMYITGYQPNQKGKRNARVRALWHSSLVPTALVRDKLKVAAGQAGR